MPATITHAKSDTIADFTGTITGYNSSGGSTTVVATDLVRPSDWNSSHQVTLKVAENELFTKGFYEPYFPQNTNSTLSAPGVGTWYLDHFMLPSPLGSGQINFLAADTAGFKNGAVYSSGSTASISRYQTLNSQIAIYNAGTGANTTRIESVFTKEISFLATWVRQINSTTAGGGTTTGVIITNSLALSWPDQYDASGGVTYSSTAQSGTTSTSVSTGASTMADNLITGAIAYLSGSKYVPFPLNTSLPAGEYYLGLMISSTSSSTGTNFSTGTMFSTQSVMGNLEFVNQAYKILGASASNSSTCILPFHGSVATVSSTPLSSLGTSDMRNFATGHRRYWNYLQSTY